VDVGPGRHDGALAGWGAPGDGHSRRRSLRPVNSCGSCRRSEIRRRSSSGRHASSAAVGFRGEASTTATSPECRLPAIETACPAVGPAGWILLAARCL
jgi:hypothetical protein